ncbi:EamA-like transporter family protein [Salinihabitans flavidus]|uniref:EamA-like transporter family protein n=1 Tax=Salinihabitans flavidus TaxID=569882 RepID=A0A1H8LBN2_9RHOB|nr:EamA family transporter [Salinihabitans flavidus]SEO02469.1 EamA-like transporter family protein [Salinihabitans flavidus]
MSETLIALEGTEAGSTLAMALALLAAFLHAVFGALQKGRHDPWLTRGAIDFWLVVLSLPIALFLVPWPEGRVWWLLVGGLGIHFVYKLGMALAYARGAFTVVYPVVRGMGPLFTVIGAWLIFGESFSLVQWAGVGVLLAGIFGLAVYNLIHVDVGRETLVPALWLAVGTGALVALYTTYDAYGIRATPNPFTFLAWFFLITAVDFPGLAYLRWRSMVIRPPVRPLLRRGFIGALVAYGSFGSVMLATRLDKVGEAAVLRETSTVFAALIGWLVLRETVGPRRIALMALIAAGAVIVEIGG